MAHKGKSELSNNNQTNSDQNPINSKNTRLHSNNLSTSHIFQLSQENPEANNQPIQICQSNQICQTTKCGNHINKNYIGQRETSLLILSHIIHNKIFENKFIEQLYKNTFLKAYSNESNEDYLSNKHKLFSPEEDEMLKKVVCLFGAKNWKLIATMIPGRIPRQCRDRYANYLAPGFVHKQWSSEEDILLAEKYKIYGPKWTQMKQFFPQRTANDIKNRYNYTISRKQKLNKKENQNISRDNSIKVFEKIQDDSYWDGDENGPYFYNDDFPIEEFDFSFMDEQFDN